MTEFTTTVSDVDIYDKQNSWTSSKMTVKWTYETDMRSWGIKGSVILVREIEGSIIKQDEDGNDLKEILVKDLGFEVMEDIGEKEIYDDIYPHNIEIDFSHKSITVSF